MPGPPKQIMLYTQRYLLKALGFAAKKKTMKTLTAMASDHQESDCMNLQGTLSAVTLQSGSGVPGIRSIS